MEYKRVKSLPQGYFDTMSITQIWGPVKKAKNQNKNNK